MNSDKIAENVWHKKIASRYVGIITRIIIVNAYGTFELRGVIRSSYVCWNKFHNPRLRTITNILVRGSKSRRILTQSLTATACASLPGTCAMRLPTRNPT